MEERNKTLGEFIIENQNAFQYSSGELSRIINSIRLAAKVVNYKVNKAGLVDIVGAAGEQNIQGEDQQKLDVYANEVFIQTLINREIVCGIASEENDDFITVEGSDNSHNNKYVVLMDPLDGSSNIDVNVSVGTIFSVYRRVTPIGTPVTIEDFLQPGINQVAAGYVIYGTSTMLGLYYWSWSEWFYFKPCHWNLLFVAPQHAIFERWIYLFNQRGQLHSFSARSKRLYKILSNRRRGQALYFKIHRKFSF